MAKLPDKTAHDIAWAVVQKLKRELVGKKKEIADEEWAEAIEAAINPYVEDDDRYQDGYDDGYDEGYQDAEDEASTQRQRLRNKKRSERAEAKAKRGVIKITR